jgi:hypothetical protein
VKKIHSETGREDTVETQEELCENNLSVHSTLVLYSTLLYSTLLYSTLLYCTLLCFTLLYFTPLYFVLLYSTSLLSPAVVSMVETPTRAVCHHEDGPGAGGDAGRYGPEGE